MTPALRGARIILTRPEKDSAGIARALRHAGARILFFPALALQGNDEVPPRGPFDAVIFSSPAAVRFGWDRVHGVLPDQVAAPGQGTAGRLLAAGIERVITPRRGAGLDALLAEPTLRAALAGARVLLVCGRPLNRGSLARLAALGADAEAFCAYERRAVTQAAPLEAWLHQGAADAIMVSSVAAVDALAALARRARFGWGGIDWIASSPRVAAAVKAREGRLGAVADSANARALVDAANEWWSSKQQ